MRAAGYRSRSACSLARLPAPPYGARFPTTHWSAVLQAGKGAPSELERLVHYREPLLAYLLATGLTPPDAEDAVQDLLARLTDPKFWASVSPEKGRFRSWLLTALNHQLADARARTQAVKRGSGIPPVPLDPVSGEHAPGRALADGGRTPEQAYELKWAQTIVANAWRVLRAEFDAQGRLRWYDALEPVLYCDEDRASYQQIAKELGVSESAVSSAVRRMRGRLRALMREEVAGTVRDPVANPEEVREELDYLIRVLCP